MINKYTFMIEAFLDTIYMVFYSSLFSVIIGLILGIVLYITNKGSLVENLIINGILSFIVNIGRSIPVIILMIAILPLSRIIVGTAIGRTAAIVPLTISAIPFFARVTENALKEVNKGVIEATIAMGANNFQVITRVVLVEAGQSIINGITLTVISITGYSAMAGMLGSGGLGNIAFTIGYQRKEYFILYGTIVLIIILVQLIQIIGDFVEKRFRKLMKML